MWSLLALLLSTTAAFAQGLGLTGVGGYIATSGSSCGGSAGSITLVQHGIAQNAGSGTTKATTLTGTTAGHFIIVGIAWCNDGGCSNPTQNTVSSVASSNSGSGETCSQVSGAHQNGSGLNTDVWYCPNIVGGSDTITVTMTNTGSGDFYLTNALSEWSGVSNSTPIDAGPTNTNNGTGTTASVATNGSVAQNGELIYSMDFISTGPASTPGQTPINVISSNNYDEYQLSDGVHCTYTNSVTWTGSEPWGMSLVGFKHP